jgi:PST family polysaccharide transporter
VNQNCDTFLVAYFFGPASIGLYAIAKRLRLALQMVAATPINGVLFTTLAEVQDDRERLKSVSQRMIALICLVCAPIFLGSSSIAREAIALGFGEKWIAAGPIFAVLTLGGFFATLQGFCDSLFILKHRQIWSFYILLIQTALAILLFFLIRAWGPNYLAVPFVLPYAIVFPVLAVLASKLSGLSLSEWLSAVMPSLSSSILMFGAVKFISSSMVFSSNLTHAVICSAAGAVVYLISMLVVGRKTVVSTFRILLKLAY